MPATLEFATSNEWRCGVPSTPAFGAAAADDDDNDDESAEGLPERFSPERCRLLLLLLLLLLHLGKGRTRTSLAAMTVASQRRVDLAPSLREARQKQINKQINKQSTKRAKK